MYKNDTNFKRGPIIPILIILMFIFFINNSYSDSIASFNRPAKIVIVSGDLQSGISGQTLPEPLVVKLVDKNDNPSTFWNVTFKVIAGGGKVSWSYIKPASEIKVATNSQGIASANLTLGDTKAINQVRAFFEDLAPVTFIATVGNTPPVLQPIGNKEVNEGASLKFKVSATDINADDVLTFSASPLPANSTFDPITGIFTFNPNYTQAGIYNITFKVSDGFAEASEIVTITVKNVNQPPVLNPIGSRSVDEGNELAILVSANDPDGDVLIYSVLNIPTGATFDPSTRIFRWKPGFNVAPNGGFRNFNIIFMVKDPLGLSDSEEIIITVNDVQPLVPDIRVLPVTFDNVPSLDFGIADVGGSSERIFQIHNDGSEDLLIGNIKTSDGQFKFISYLKTNSAPIDAIDPLVLQLLDENTIISYLNINSNFVPVTYSPQNPLMSINYPIIEPGKCLLIKAQFKPITIGLKQGNFTIESNDPDEAIVLMKVRGTAIQTPDIRVSTNNIDFGNIQLGTSLTIPLTIYNDGNGTLTISSITTDDPQFTFSQYSEVGPNSNITVNVKFTPTSVGEKTSTLRINSNDPDESIVLVTLKGNAFRLPTPEISVTPTSINFGDVDVGNSSTKTFQINNTGDAILQISSITSSNNQFVVLNTSNVPAGSQVTISVRFTPTSAGSKAGLITINSNDLDEPAVVVSVQGTGVVVPQPNIRVSPTSIDFGDVVLGESLIKYMNIYNDGLAVLQITSITSNNSRFTILDNSTGIYSGGVVQIRVRFEPQVLGTVSGFITIASNDPDEPSKQIAIKGKGISPPSALIRLSPTSLDFGQVQVTKSLTKEYRIYNDGTATLNVTNIISNNDQFIPIFINTFSIAPNNFVVATVRFAPGSVGLKTGTINIISNDPNSPTKALPVQGTGFVTNVPDIAVMPMILDFGEVEINQSIISGFYIYNNGNALLQISGITSNNTQFSIITSTTTIDPDYMAPVAVRFSPNSIGSKSGKITILSNDPDSPSVEVMVYGDGTYPGLPAIGVWKQIKQTGTQNDLYDVFFTDSNRGWIAGYNGTILYTSNSGEAWLPQFSGTSRSLDGIFFTDTNNGWAVGQYGTALRTFNGGNNWSLVGMNITNSLKSIVFTELSRAWTVGDSGTIMRYNGSSWTRLNSNTSFDLMDVDFVNSSQGWAVGGFGTIIRTVDGGQNWSTQLSNTSYALNGVDFVNSYEGWAVGSGGIILHTQNSGQTWSPQNSNANFNTLTDVFFLNSMVGWAVGWNGTILYTANGGQNWVRIDSGVTENLYAVYFISPEQGWIVGANGTILKYVPGLPSSITSVNVAGSPANAGGVITITAVGQSRNTARFSIAGVVSNVSMIENPPGTYIGVYNVPKDSTINITDATVTVTLTNKYGQTATDTSQKVTIDTASMIESAGVTPNLLKAGDTVIVTASGESRGVARFTIEGVISDVYMTETPFTSGKYIGEYTIPQGTNITNAKVTVKLTDRLGNSATKEAGFVTIDTIAQIGSITITGSPAGLGKTITVTMTGETKGTARFGIKDLVASVAMTETSTGVYTGSYTAKQGDNVKNALVIVSLIDALGNTATKDGGYVTVDALCKIDLSTISGSPGRAGGTIKVDIVGDPNGSAKFSIEGVAGENALVESPVGSGKYTGNYIIPANINVTNAVVTITLVDAFGNIALDTSKKITIDNIAPEITSIEILGSPGRAGGKITVNIIGEPNAKAKFRIENIADENMHEQPLGSGKYTGSYSILSGINVQDAIVTITLLDSAGNFVTDSSKKITIDNIPPKITSVNVTGSPGRVGGKIEVSMVGEPNGTAKFNIGNILDNSMTEEPVGSGKYIGSYVIPSNVNINNAIVLVTLTDLAGNSSTDSSKRATIDNTPPKITSVVVEGSPGRAGGKIIINAYSELYADAKFKIEGVIEADMLETPASSGKYVGTYTVPEGISVKDAIVTVTITDSAGNSATNTSQKVTIDSTVPKVESIEISGSPGKAGGRIVINLTSETGLKAKFQIENFADENMKEEPAGSGKYTGAYVIRDGINIKDATVTITLIDSAGNVATDTSQKITIDNTAPHISSIKVIGSPARKGSKIVIEIQGESGGKANFSIDGVVSDQTMTELSEGNYFGEYTIPDGVDVIDAIVTITLSDLAGNKTSDKSQKVTIDTTAPKIISVDISGSPAKVNETITITLISEEKGIAQFSIAGIADNIPMNESPLGKYTGKYVVTEDKSVNNAIVTITISDSAGNITTDKSKTINIAPSWDVNRDGSVDVADITAIANSFGQKGKSDADVNGDGVVNILDLAIVCKFFNQLQTPTAPSMGLIKIDSSQLAIIKNLYDQINAIPSNDPDILLTKELLGRIIAENTPKIANSQLMQNYPNPFNPETWIPYQLKDDSQVVIKIYSVSGDLVRKLDLGYKSAGIYSDRDKSAYWDGRNEFGEHVSSGIYFYTIQAGSFSATKKMIIQK